MVFTYQKWRENLHALSSKQDNWFGFIGRAGRSFFETPVDKQDLVRFQDSYGRQGKPYEDSTYEYPKQDECVWLEEPSIGQTIEYEVGNATLKLYNITDVDFFNSFEQDKNIMFLKGGIITDYDINVAAAGDVVNTSVLKKLIKVFSKVQNNTIVMVME